MHSFYVGVNAIADGCHRGAESDQQDVRGSLRSRCLKCSKFLKRSGVQGVTHCIVRNVRIDSVMPVVGPGFRHISNRDSDPRVAQCNTIFRHISNIANHAEGRH
jgi:hypothetical protein